MLHAAQYQRLAQECLDMAERADQNNRDMLHRLAEAWLRLATEELTEASRKAKRVALAC